MSSFRFLICATGFLLAACGSEAGKGQPRLPTLGKAFTNLPLPPNPVLVSRAGSEDALQLTLQSPADEDQVLRYYRGVLSSDKWRLISDTRNRDGSTVLYAEHDGRPMWVRIWKSGDRGTMVELSGAVVSKPGNAKPQPKASTKPGK